MADRATAPKLDLKVALKAFYSATATPRVVDVPALKFLMIDGAGDPNTSPDYQAALEALYGVSYTLKFALKRGSPSRDFGVMPLEGLWWAKDMSAFLTGDKSSWSWTAMILQPDFVTAAHVGAANVAAAQKRQSPALQKLRLETFREGRAAQLLHVGPYSAEGPNIERLHAFIAEQGGRLTGKHHEIYLGDPRRSAPDKLKTIIRQPFAARQPATTA
jgi:hypothetical protein